MESGAQLYTLREFCKTTEDFAETLKRVADIGYRTVQVSGTCAYEPAWLAEQLRKNGLACVLTHTPPERIQAMTEQVMADHAVFGCRRIGIGCAPHAFLQGLADWEQLCGIIDSAADKLHDNGFLLMYHNHNMEFAHALPGGQTYFEALLERYSAEKLGITLDTYWLQAGGMDVVEQIRALRGRIPCVHLKDMTVVVREQRMAPVGEGNLNFDRILPACADAGTEYVLVEQDDCYGEDPFDCMRRSYQYLKARGIQ